jgi:hypothetical protein
MGEQRAPGLLDKIEGEKTFLTSRISADGEEVSVIATGAQPVSMSSAPRTPANSFVIDDPQKKEDLLRFILIVRLSESNNPGNPISEKPGSREKKPGFRALGGTRTPNLLIRSYVAVPLYVGEVAMYPSI